MTRCAWSLHKDDWMMQRISVALDSIRYADYAGLETELDLLAFAEDVLGHYRQSPAQYVAGLAEDEALVTRLGQAMDPKYGHKPLSGAQTLTRHFLRALAVLVEREAGDE